MRDTILVIGGNTGKKLHKAYKGSSSLACGTWLKQSVVDFMVEEIGKDFDVEKYHNSGGILCSKCFPTYAEKIKTNEKYNGPKVHMHKTEVVKIEGKIEAKTSKRSSCKKGEKAYNKNYMEFSNFYKEDEDKCCKNCVSHMNLIKENIDLIK